jgi:hypothetical protein
MPLPYIPNLSIDLVRGFDPNSPYPLNCGDVKYRGLKGYMRANMEAGRFGYQTQGLYWTHRMDFALGTDARDAYNTQLVAKNIQAGDTLLAADYLLKGQCTAFYVVFVTVDRGGNFLRVYLDRLAPCASGCYSDCVASNGCCCQLCTQNNIPLTLNWRWQGTLSASGQMTWAAQNPGGGFGGPGWYSPVYFEVYPTQVYLVCADPQPYCVVNCGATLYNGVLQAGVVCKPFSARFLLTNPVICTGDPSPQYIQLTQ